MINNIKYYIVGPRHNWEISRSTFIVLGLLLAIIFFLLIIYPTYQFLTNDHTIQTLEENLKFQRSATQKLESELSSLQQQITNLQNELDKKSLSLENLQTTQKTDTQAQLASQEKVFKYQLEIKNLLSTLKNKNNQIKLLEEKQKKQNEQIQSLTLQFRSLEKKYQTSFKNTSTPFQKSTQALFLEQIQINAQKNDISIRFNLRNTSNEIQTGYISMVPLSSGQLDKDILFDRNEAVSFSIKKFSSFSREIKVADNQSISAIRVIVWNKNKTKLLNQNFLIQ